MKGKVLIDKLEKVKQTIILEIGNFKQKLIMVL